MNSEEEKDWDEYGKGDTEAEDDSDEDDD